MQGVILQTKLDRDNVETFNLQRTEKQKIDTSATKLSGKKLGIS